MEWCVTIIIGRMNICTILQQKDSQGVIIWQMYSKPNESVKDAATSQYTMNQSCKTFLGKDNRFDCNADFPSSTY